MNDNNTNTPSESHHHHNNLHQQESPFTLGNLFHIVSDHLDQSRNENIELFQPLFKTNATLIERIISTGQFTPSDEWYDQERDEFVVLLQGESTLLMECKREDHIELKEVKLKKGDYINIPKHVRHRVKSTSVDPPCIWLAVHYS
ncbi:hypothetical protein FDP41_009322 [Naegleria fowleri]|uniref:Cupin type-2 domain-containing protein n=1 Tax=Naegleria fowleri TaxID=5763 RepID=A0A6A5BHC5_NAEFO|nr:uncharacterized protein FDP41_009322 [Naegleria fowleri]KAF0972419.1 hypothetical protein FDP41_009322 [Naegleria fowleri]CAG4709870.1 unnamed protein product [Naegleria fowleri]